MLQSERLREVFQGNPFLPPPSAAEFPKAVSSSPSKMDECLHLPPLQINRKKTACKEKKFKATLILEPHREGQKLHLTASRIQDHKGSRLHYFS